MGKRTTSWGTIANVGIDAYQLKRLSNISSEVNNIRSSVQRDTQNAVATGTAITLSAISSVADLQVGMMHNLREMDSKLETLENISWNISSYLDRKEMRDQFVGSMRMILHYMERELDEIDQYLETHTEYAVMKLEIIRDRIAERDVKVDHFAQVSMEEMKHAQSVLDRIESMYQISLQKLRDS
tara:strand:- start:3111 stop:3662 length:552 start_codon:yes stop_codon:yes gene_type:complete